MVIIGISSSSAFHFKAQMPVHNADMIVLNSTEYCRCHGNRCGRESEMLVHFEDAFGYHGNQVTKATDHDIPSDRTPGKL